MFVNLQFYLYIELSSQFWMHNKVYTTNETVYAKRICKKNSILTLWEASSFHSFVGGGRLSRAFKFSVKRVGAIKINKTQ